MILSPNILRVCPKYFILMFNYIIAWNQLSSLVFVLSIYTVTDVHYNYKQQRTLFILFNFLRPINNLSVIKGRVFLGWTSTKLGLMCLAQGHNAGTPVRLEPAALRSRVTHSTTEPLYSLEDTIGLSKRQWRLNLFVFQIEWISFQNILEGNAFQKQAVNVGRIFLPSALERKTFQSDLEWKTFQSIDFGAWKVFLPVSDC